MLKKIFVTAMFAVCFSFCQAQTEIVKVKILNHYLGVQANQLFRQLINLNTGSTVISNPYLLTYSVYSVKYKWGLQAGFRYNYYRVMDTESPTNHESNINHLF